MYGPTVFNVYVLRSTEYQCIAEWVILLCTVYQFSLCGHEAFPC